MNWNPRLITGNRCLVWFLVIFSKAWLNASAHEENLHLGSMNLSRLVGPNRSRISGPKASKNITRPRFGCTAREDIQAVQTRALFMSIFCFYSHVQFIFVSFFPSFFLSECIQHRFRFFLIITYLHFCYRISFCLSSTETIFLFHVCLSLLWIKPTFNIPLPRRLAEPCGNILWNDILVSLETRYCKQIYISSSIFPLNLRLLSFFVYLSLLRWGFDWQVWKSLQSITWSNFREYWRQN